MISWQKTIFVFIADSSYSQRIISVQIAGTATSNTTSTTSSTAATTATSASSQNYSYYKKQVEDLKKTYETKEEKVLELLEKKFPNGQMTYGRFRGEVDVCRVNFFKEAEAAENMINLSDGYSEKIADALKEKISTLQSIVAKMNDLQSELIISISNGDDGSDEEIDNLIKEMNDLIDSVKDYD